MNETKTQPTFESSLQLNPSHERYYTEAIEESQGFNVQAEKKKDDEMNNPTPLPTTIPGGYTVVKAASLYNLLVSLKHKQIGYKTARCYLGLIEMRARRTAAFAKQTETRTPHFTLSELSEIVSGPVTRRDINPLLNQGLITQFDSHQVQVRETPLPITEDLIQSTSQGRSANRKIPLPRRLLRFLATCSKPALLKTLIAYLLRGLSLKRGGAIQSKGSVKCSWLSTLTSLGLRVVKRSRQRLIQMKIISKDEQSHQRKLNRTGAYFEINLGWSSPPEADSEWSPPPIKSDPELSPLKKEKDLLTEPKNQNLPNSEPPVDRLDSGASKKPSVVDPPSFKTAISAPTAPKPTPPKLHDIQETDLRQPTRLHQLYREAVKQGWIDASEATALNVIGAAVRSLSAKGNGDPVRIFVAIVRRGLWHHITQAQEQTARVRLAQWRDKIPRLFRVQPSPLATEQTHASNRMVAKLKHLVTTTAQKLATQRQRC